MQRLGLSQPFDHLVMPVGDLDVARGRLGRLGFTVASTALHPFGTENACVYFADGSYLEPLAVADPAKALDAARQGNVFTARDAEYRSSRDGDGFSAIAFRTDDAEADHRRFEASGISAGQMLEFSRPFAEPDGQSRTASFRLAFAADRKAPDLFLFSCERTNAPAVDRSKLQAHENQVTGIVAVTLSSGTPEDFAGFVAVVADSNAKQSTTTTIRQETPSIEILSGDELKDRYGLSDDVGQGMLARVVRFATRDLVICGKRLDASGIGHKRTDRQIVVPAAPGQGAVFVFEESQ